MPSGAAVTVYEGKRGRTFRVKYRDASGRQVMETLGREADGWTERKAAAELRERLVRVERQRYRRPPPLTFADFTERWIDEHAEARGLKRSTREGYRAIVKRHLLPALGSLKLAAVDVDALERYVARKKKAGLQPRTINRHLNVLSALSKTALRRGLVATNPVVLVERPREPRRRWTILSPAEVGRIERAFTELASEAEGSERAWVEQARVAFLAVLFTGLRRGEVLGLRWRHVFLADPEGARLEVRETVVYGRAETPKSERAERTIALGPKLADELFEHRARSAFAGDDERVFCHPETGGVLDHKRYAKTLDLALAKAKVDKPLRPFHDGRHSSITNAAAAGTPPAALQARAGHSDFSTTQLYIDLAGETFRDEAERLERRLAGSEAVEKTGRS
jgi:site-specific recombinase XerD